MPESVQRAGVPLRIPLTYIQLISSYLYLRCLQKDSIIEFNILPLQIDISYGDISGRRHQVSFSLRVHVSAMSTMMFDGYIDAEKLA